jgi:serine/threonine protein kinase
VPGPDPTDSILGQTLDGKYRIDALIGRGGMGAVYKAEHVGTGRPVAVKTILPRLVKNADLVERFRREARAAGSLRHPNIVDVTDFGVASVGIDRVAYLVMEYLEGSTLHELIEESGALPVEVVVDVVEQVAHALDSAHRLGIVHRDLKPDNIWLVRDARGGYVVRILDFGIAKLCETESGERVDATAHALPTLPDVPGADDVTAIRSAEGDATEVLADDEAATRIRAEEDVETSVRESDDGETAIRVPDEAPTLVTPARQAAFPFDPATPVDEATEIRAKTSPTPSQPLTTAGMTLGTPAYMSPEQCRSEPVDARSDIYSLGIVAWQALTGDRPFHGSYLELVRQHTEVTAPRADDVNPAVPAKVADALAISLAKDPRDRFPSAGGMAGSLRVAAEGGSVVLRKAAALYLDRFESFLAISYHASRPALVLLVLTLLALPLFTEDPIGIFAAALLGSVLWGAVTVMTHSVFSVVIERLRTQPLSPVRTDDVFRELNRRIGLSEDAGIWSAFCRVGVFYFEAEMRAPPGLGDLAFQIAFHEGRAPKDTLERCKLLASVTKKSFDWVRFVILGSILILPSIEACVLLTLGRLLRLHPADLFIWVVVIVMLSLPLIALVTSPMLSPALAILYFRARQANGEDVGLSAVIPSRL